jgi:putative DNA primase/helicase
VQTTTPRVVSAAGSAQRDEQENTVLIIMVPDTSKIKSDSAPQDVNGHAETVASIADRKKLPAEFLRDLGLTDLRGGGVRIPYFGEDGEEMFTRTRGVPGEPRFKHPSGIKLHPYGLWRLDQVRRLGVAYLAEGESDTWVLWHHGLPALGLPGADTTGALQAEHLDGVNDLYICPDNDQGGERFVKNVKAILPKLGFEGRTWVLRLPKEIKDVGDLHADDPATFKEKLVELTKDSELLLDRTPAPEGTETGEPSPNGTHTTASSAGPGKAKAEADGKGDPTPPTVNEAVDDPHRLARLYLNDHAHPDGRTLHCWREEWHRWSGGAYFVVKDKEIKAELTRRIKVEFDEVNLRAVAAWEATGGVDSRGKGVSAPVVHPVTTKKVADVLQALAGYTLLPGCLEAPAWLGTTSPFPAAEVLACRNTLVHLPSWAEGRPHVHPLTPAFFSPNALDYDYLPQALRPAEWLNALRNWWPNDPEAIDTLQEWFGYCLLPDTSLQKILLMVGPMRSGKGTVARVLRALVGLRNTASPTLSSLGGNFGLWPLLGKTLATISDARLSGRSDQAQITERLLSISGEDAQDVDRKNMTVVTTTLRVRFVILTNELPRLNDASGALAGRMVILSMSQSWYGKEDKGLTDRLLAELPGILLWAMEGWKRLRARGYFVQPGSGQKLMDHLKDLTSPVGAFVRERCEVGPGFEVAVTELYLAWKSWCEAKGREPGSEQVFGRDLRAAVPALDDRRPLVCGHRVRLYVGVRLRDCDDGEGWGEYKTPF